MRNENFFCLKNHFHFFVGIVFSSDLNHCCSIQSISPGLVFINYFCWNFCLTFGPYQTDAMWYFSLPLVFQIQYHVNIIQCKISFRFCLYDEKVATPAMLLMGQLLTHTTVLNHYHLLANLLLTNTFIHVRWECSFFSYQRVCFLDFSMCDFMKRWKMKKFSQCKYFCIFSLSGWLQPNDLPLNRSIFSLVYCVRLPLQILLKIQQQVHFQHTHHLWQFPPICCNFLRLLCRHEIWNQTIPIHKLQRSSQQVMIIITSPSLNKLTRKLKYLLLTSICWPKITSRIRFFKQMSSGHTVLLICISIFRFSRLLSSAESPCFMLQ